MLLPLLLELHTNGCWHEPALQLLDAHSCLLPFTLMEWALLSVQLLPLMLLSLLKEFWGRHLGKKRVHIGRNSISRSFMYIITTGSYTS